jgi:dynein heavy chain 1, cytosolic
MLEKLPGQLELLKRTAQAITNPLFRFLEREVTVTSHLLDTVRADMLAVLDLCKGVRKQTNILKQLSEDIHAEIIPKQWRKYTIANISVTEWVADFVKRCEQLKTLTESKDYGQSGLWFGGLLFPEAYLTATRQAVAQNNSWSLEDVQLSFEIDLPKD